MTITTLGDIDIDVKTKTIKPQQFGVRAIIHDKDKNKITPHPSGYFIDDTVAVDCISHMACTDYKVMESHGFNKIDLLNNTSYDIFSSKDDLLECITDEPEWNLLTNASFVATLPHLANHHELLMIIRPTSIQELADVLALIRPAKIKYIEAYINSHESVRENLYRKPKSGYYIKKSHAVAYAYMIVAIMNKRQKSSVIVY